LFLYSHDFFIRRFIALYQFFKISSVE
jgi:hypothetical protein